MTTRQPVLTLADFARPTDKSQKALYDAILVVGGSLLIAASAQLSLQIGPVPITGQTFGVLIVAALLGWRRGGTAIVMYLLEGAVGLPVFASGAAGFATFFGPTGGYLLGFLPAAMLVGWLAERGWDRNIITTMLAMVLGNLVIYACGVPWLKTVLAVSWEQAAQFGLTPFLLGDLVKVVAAAMLLPAGWRLLNAFSRPR